MELESTGNLFKYLVVLTLDPFQMICQENALEKPCPYY